MPTISPQIRATIGDAVTATPRSTVKATTGMNLPHVQTTETTENQKTGQPNIKEETTPQAVTLSPQLTALARKQQKLQQEIQAQREKEAAWATKEADYLPKSAFKAKLQQNAAEALKELGVDYEELSHLLIDQANGADPVKELRSEIDQIKKSQEESTNKQYGAILNQYKVEAEKLIKGDDKYLMIREEPEASKAAVDELVADWEASGEAKDISYYLDLAEEGLREVATQFNERLKKLNPKTEETETKKILPPPKQAAPRTLTQQVETTPTRTYNQFQHLSMKERIAQAVARAQR